MKTLREEIRGRYTIEAKRAANSPRSACRLFCVECMGGSKVDAAACEVTECFLWPFRPGTKAVHKGGMGVGFPPRHATISKGGATRG